MGKVIVMYSKNEKNTEKKISDPQNSTDFRADREPHPALDRFTAHLKHAEPAQIDATAALFQTLANDLNDKALEARLIAEDTKKSKLDIATTMPRIRAALAYFRPITNGEEAAQIAAAQLTGMPPETIAYYAKEIEKRRKRRSSLKDKMAAARLWKAGLSQSEIANRLGVHQSTVSRWIAKF